MPAWITSCGSVQRPVHPFTKNRFHYNWHWNWLYGNGDLGKQGIHQVNVARWGMGLGFPNQVSAMGGHFMFDDDQANPNDSNCSFAFHLRDGKKKMITFEVRHWIANHEAEIGTRALGTPEPEKSAPDVKLGPMAGSHNTVGNIFCGSNGYVSTGDEDQPRTELGRGSGAAAVGPRVKRARSLSKLLDCVKSRNKAALNALIEEAQISCALVHLANASHRLGRTINFDPATQDVIGDEEAAILLRDGDRGYRAPSTVLGLRNLVDSRMTILVGMVS